MRLNEKQTEIVKGIQASVLECEICPPERHCCYLDDKFGMYMPEEVVHELFGKNIAVLIEHEVIIPFDRVYRFAKRCPLLDEDHHCIVHEHKERLDLMECIGYPMWPGWTKDDVLGSSNYFVVDYRCYSVEKNWKALDKTLKNMTIDGKLQISDIRVPILIKYLEDNNVHKRQIEFFRQEHDKGNVKPQRLSTSKKRAEIVNSKTPLCCLERRLTPQHL